MVGTADESNQSRDFRGQRLEDVDFTDAHLHAPNFERARITDGYFYGADISADITGLVLNGVEVAPLVQAERERLFPELAKLRATDPAGLREAWALIESIWDATVARTGSLPEPLLFERVNREWSFVETLRHLIMATDAWLFRMVRGEPHAYHPWGLAGSFLTDPAALGLDYSATPSFEQVLAVRRGRMDAVASTIEAATPEELARVCAPPATPGHPSSEHTVLECLHVILDEEWEHNRYANRDLDVLTSHSSNGGGA